MKTRAADSRATGFARAGIWIQQHMRAALGVTS